MQSHRTKSKIIKVKNLEQQTPELDVAFLFCLWHIHYSLIIGSTTAERISVISVLRRDYFSIGVPFSTRIQMLTLGGKILACFSFLLQRTGILQPSLCSSELYVHVTTDLKLIVSNNGLTSPFQDICDSFFF